MYLILSNFIDFGFSRKNQICENFYPFANTYSPVKAIDLRSIPQTTFDLAIAIFRYLIVIVRHRKKTYQIAFLSTDMTWFDENSLSILLQVTADVGYFATNLNFVSTLFITHCIFKEYKFVFRCLFVLSYNQEMLS